MKRMLLVLALLLCASPCFAQLVLTANLAGQVNAPIDQNGWQSFKVTLTQNITFSFVILPLGTPPPAQSSLRVIFVQDAIGGRTVTFASNILNACTITTGASSTTICQFAFDGTTNTWQGVGGGAGGVPGQFSVKTYGAVGDAKATSDCVVTNTSNVFTSASNPWLASDVGKFIYSSGGYGNPPFAPQKITGFTNPGSITVTNAAGGSATVNCVWFTQKDTVGFTGALAAAKASLASVFRGQNLAYPAQVYCPPGGYVLDGSWFTQNYATANTNGVSFQGAGRSSCQIYISPDFVAGTGAVFGYNQQASNIFMDGFSVTGEQMTFSLGALPGFRFANATNLRLSNFSLMDYTNSQDTGSPSGMLSTENGTGILLENLLIVAGGAGPMYNCTGSGAVLGLNNTLSNGSGINLSINCGSRGGSAQPFVWKGALVDECGAGAAAACTLVTSTSVVDFDSVGIYGESSVFGALNCLGTCYLNSVDVGSFNSATNQPAIALGSTGYVYVTGSWIRGNGTSPMVTGTSAATLVDAGGNKWLNGTGSTFNPVTAAQYATLGFTGGIVPKAAVTHTPNTCFAVTGNLLATAQNICTLLLDQNYQLVNIAAQSGGTTPASSSCATPPVITLSDGTRSETMTMTSGQTVWCSATSGSCTASSVTNPNQVFANGALLTVSIGANTCATPPSNVSVNYVLQSVLNP